MRLRPSSSSTSAARQRRRVTAREFAARSKAMGRQHFCTVFDGAVKLAAEPGAGQSQHGLVKHRRGGGAARAPETGGKLSSSSRRTSGDASRRTSVDASGAASGPENDCPMCKILNESLSAARAENEAVNVALRAMQAKIRRLARHEIEARAAQSLAQRDLAVTSSLCERFGLQSAEHAVRRFEQLERAKSEGAIALAEATRQIEQLQSALSASQQNAGQPPVPVPGSASPKV